MASQNDATDLPTTWPFRAAGLVTMVALAWFCTGFALEDVGEHLPNHTNLFWILMGAALLLVIGGAVYNSGMDRVRRKK